MQKRQLDKIGSGGDHLIFADEEEYELKISNVSLKRCDFNNVGLKEALVSNSTLTQCRFIDSYMSKAKFEDVDLTGSMFDHCNLRDSSFTNCKLWYVTFRFCELNYSSLLENLPKEVNLRRRLLRSLRLNATAMGETQFSKRLLLEEMEAERREAASIVWASEDYFRKNFTPWDRAMAAIRWLNHQLQRAAWGYGVRIIPVMRAAFLIILLFASLNWLLATPYFGPGFDAKARALNLWEYVYVSSVTFTTLGFGDFAPAEWFGQALASVESMLGAIFLALLAATFYRNFQR